MLTAYSKSNSPLLNWSVDEKIKRVSLGKILATDYVVADGRELSWILNSYLNMPHHRTVEPQIWTGDLARFIVGQLSGGLE